jgi:Protein of unknown function (DUF3102)
MGRTAAKQETMQDTMDAAAVNNAGNALALQGTEVHRLMEAYHITTANPDALVAEIRGYMSSAVEVMFGIGARLIVLKTLTEHGQWLPLLDSIGVSQRTAARIVQATIKFSDPKTLKAKGRIPDLGRSKMLELLVLDDEQIDALENGESVLELDLDEVSRMSTTELRKALREARAKVDAKDKLLERRNKDVDRLQEQLDKPYQPSEGAVAQTQEEQAQFLALQEAHLEAIAAQSRLAVIVRDIKAGSNEALAEEADAAMRHLCQRTAETVNEHGIAVDFMELVTPSWLQAAPKKAKKS